MSGSLALAVVASTIVLLAAFGPYAQAASGDGYTWVGQNPLGTSQQLYATSVFSATAAWSVGEYGTILYWNGTTLAKQNSTTTNNLYGVYARSATRMWAVGENGTILYSSNSGTTWVRQGVGVTPYDLNSVTVVSNTTAYAVGGYDGFNNAVILRTTNTGTTWSVVLSQATGGFTDVYAFDTGHIWAVGIWTWYSTNGTTWTKVNDGNSTTGIDPYRVTGYSATNLYAIGWSGKVLRSVDAGTTWTAVADPPGGTWWPVDVDSFNATNIFVGGWGGSIALFNGTTWSSLNSGTTNDLYSIDSSAANAAFACGDQRFIRYGTTWTGMSGGTGSQLNTVNARDASNVWAAGTNVATFGNIQTTTNGGVTWGTLASGTTETINGVDTFDSTRTWTAGQQFIRFYSGAAWTTQVNGSDTVGSTITIGATSSPRSCAANPVTNKIYVANAGTNNVSVINSATDALITTISGVGASPRGLCVNPVTNKVYVTSNTDNTICVIDGSTDTISKAPFTYGSTTTPYRCSVNTLTNKVYVANYGSLNISVLDGATDTFVKNIALGAGTGPISCNVNQVTNKIYTANYTSGTCSVIDGATDTLTTSITVNANPYDVGVNPNTNKIYIPNAGSGNVSVINGATDTVTSTVTVGTNDRGVGVNPNTNKIYVMNSDSNNVSVIDGTSDTVMTTISIGAGTGPFGACANTANNKVYVTNWTNGTVSVIRSASFMCISAAAANRVWAGANDGSIRYYNGTSWATQTPDAAFFLAYNGIAAPDTSHVWAVGDLGEIVYWNGASWAKQTSNTTNTLRAVTAINASTAWAVGDGGVIRYTNNAGVTWQTQASGTAQDLLGVSAVDATHVWAVGTNGTILFYDGTSWTAQDSKTTNTLRAVSAYDANDAWAVGDNGTIIFADPPYIKGCAPGWGNPGDTVDVQVYGAYTHFSASTPTLSFGDGVTVVPGTVDVVDNTHVLAQVYIDPSAATGPRDVNVITTGETPVPLAGGFVVGGSPTICSVNEPVVPRGWSGDVEITGSLTSFAPESQATFGSGVTVNSVTCEDIYKVIANITVDAAATPGPRDVNVTTGGETPVPLAGGFTVATPPAVNDVSPLTGGLGSPVTITGSGFGDSQGGSLVTFNGTPALISSDHWADGQVVTDVPPGATSGPVVVTTTSGTSNADKLFDVPAPAVTSCSPTSAVQGETVNIDLTGVDTNFVNGSSVATFSGGGITVNSTSVSSATRARANITLADGATPGPRDVNVTTGAETPAPLAGGFTVNKYVPPTPPKSSSSFYFAEGYTGEGFAEYLCLGNPGNAPATADVTYLFSDGTSKNASYHVPATGRTTVNVNSEVGSNREVSMRVLSDVADLVAERPLYFNYQGKWTGGSDVIGASAPDTDWYFAEGNTLPGFEEYICVLNTEDSAANLKFRYMVEGAGEKTVKGVVGPHSRATFKTRDQIGSNVNASLHLSSDRAVVAERPMYFDYSGLASNGWTGGHDVMGANAAEKQWYFAEGSTGEGFEEWLCLLNPGKVDITVNATYQQSPGQGGIIKKAYAVPAGQRVTVSVNREIGPDKDAAVSLASTGDFVAERSMYFDYRGVCTGGHTSMGAGSPETRWLFAEGTTREDFNEWICLQNPGVLDAQVWITFCTPSGKAIQRSFIVKAASRLTIDVNRTIGNGRDVSAKVSSDNPIIVERPMYFDYNGWTGGHDVVGLTGR
jgi:YVTN family beta-propeller protein